MAEINETGFVQKTQNEYFEEERQLYLDIDPNWNLDPSTPDGLKLASDAELYGNIDEVLLEAYNSKDPARARGTDLDIIAIITGTTRDLGTPSTVTLALGGVAGTTVLAGKQVSTQDGSSVWTTDNTVTLIDNTTVTTTATATVNGATQADANSITRIVDTVGGWQTVNNPNVATPGANPESDGQLRLSRDKQVGRPGNNQLDNVRGEIGAVPGVVRFVVGDNDTDSTDSNGIPARNVYAIVEGGTDEAVALAIYAKKNPGAPWFSAGTPVVVTVTSPLYPRQTTVIRFGRPVPLDMNVIVTIQNDGTIIQGTIQAIKDAIVAYGNGTVTTLDQEFNSSGFDIGEDVSISRLYTPINSVIGALGNSYVSDLTVNGVTSNDTITIAFDGISRWTDSNIAVNII